MQMQRRRGALKSFLWMLVCGTLIGCGGEPPSGSPQTQQAKTSSIIAEATAIQAARQADEARIVATVEALNTLVAHKAAVNVHLHATMRAALPAVTRVAAHGGGVPTPEAILQGRRWFVKTGMASGVSESDGCSHSPESEFNPGIPRIYATFKAYNIESGTPLSVSWAHEGRTVLEESFQLERSASEICLWFYIDPAMVDFAPGMWTAQLYADGFPLESAMAFHISHDA